MLDAITEEIFRSTIFIGAEDDLYVNERSRYADGHTDIYLLAWTDHNLLWTPYHPPDGSNREALDDNNCCGTDILRS